MFTKLFHKNTGHRTPPPSPPWREQPPLQSPSPAASSPRNNPSSGTLRKEDIKPRVTVHYGIPSTASVLAFDPIQSLLAIGTLDGRIKLIGGDNIEGLLVSPKQIPFKYLEFLQNQGFLVSVTNENEIQVWDLEQRQIASAIQWESNLTAFTVITGTSYMYVGDEYGMVSVLKYDADEVKLALMPYYVPTNSIAEASGTSSPDLQSVVGLLPQPSYHGNRLLIAYQDGLIILWDVLEDKVIKVKGNKDLHSKNTIIADSHQDTGLKISDDKSEYEQEEKEISSLCWISSDGSILAVGYVDGDILLWNLSSSVSAKDLDTEKSSDIIKLQLSSCDRKLPVIILHWSAIGSCSSHDGQLFVYGGDAIGSEEVLTILSLDWSSGIENLKCIGRVDLTLDGSFADMVLLPIGGTAEASGTIVLTNPGQLHFYDHNCLSSLMSLQEKKNYVSSVQYPMVIPTIEPYLTVAKLGSVYMDGKFSRALSETISSMKQSSIRSPGSWPLTGGVPSQISNVESYQIERVYVAGYHDGSIRIWDATYPTFSLIYVLEPEVKGINLTGAGASVTAVEFCSFTMSLAVGNDLGMVRLYSLLGSKSETSLCIVTNAEKEVHTLHQGTGAHCIAVFSILDSAVCTLQFANLGTRLAMGFKCGQVAMVDVSTSSVLFLVECIPDSSSPIKFLALKSILDSVSLSGDPSNTESKNVEADTKRELLVMTTDADFVVVDADTGSKLSSQPMELEKNSIVISADILGTCFSWGENSISSDGTQVQVDLETSADVASDGKRVEDSLLLLCCVNALHLYSLKSLNEGDSKPIKSINLMKTSCWTTTFQKNDKEHGLIILYQTGVVEIRSLPNLEVVGETSLMVMLRWNFKNNMEKTMCSSHNAQIMLVNGCEYASLSLLACENDFRIPDSLPCLHDKVLAAAADVPSTLSPNQKKMQGAASGILGGFMKGFQGSKVEHSMDPPERFANNFTHLGSIFSNPPFLKPSMTFTGDDNVVELSIDDIDIDIDGPVVVSSSTGTSVSDMKAKGTERDRLFEGAATDSKPQLRTVDEIRAKYRKEDPATAAAHARDKLAERQEKLERLSLRTQELQSGAEDFASMAHELAKQMEKRKWWNI